jgi:hypothetical protein
MVTTEPGKLAAIGGQVVVLVLQALRTHVTVVAEPTAGVAVQVTVILLAGIPIAAVDNTFAVS